MYPKNTTFCYIEETIFFGFMQKYVYIVCEEVEKVMQFV